MRSKDKFTNMQRVTKLFEERCNEDSGRAGAKVDIKKDMIDNGTDFKLSDDWDESWNVGLTQTFDKDSVDKNKELSKDYPDLNPYKDNIKNTKIKKSTK